MSHITDTAAATQVMYMLDDGVPYETTTYGPYFGAADIDFEALKAEYRAERYKAAEAKGDDWCHVSGSEFIGWLVERRIIVPVETRSVSVPVETDGDHKYVPSHWPLCPECEEGRGEEENGTVRHSLNAVERFNRCTNCGHEWGHYWDQWCGHKPMEQDDGRYLGAVCVPYAISQAGSIPIDTVVATCRELGWTETGGMMEVNGIAAAKQLGLILHQGEMPSGDAGKMTLKQFIRMADPAKTYLLSTSDHWFALVRGENRDQGGTSLRRYLHRFWEVTPATQGVGG